MQDAPTTPHPSLVHSSLAWLETAREGGETQVWRDWYARAETESAATSDRLPAPLACAWQRPLVPGSRLRDHLGRLAHLHEALGLGPATWLDLDRPLGELVGSTFYGGQLVPVGLGHADMPHLQSSLDGGSSPQALLDGPLATGLLHEFCHGPARPWHGAPGSWMVLEAGAALLQYELWPASVLPSASGVGLHSLRRYLDLGLAFVRKGLREPLLRHTLAGRHTTDHAPAALWGALAQVDRSVWLQQAGPPFAPDPRSVAPWVAVLPADTPGVPVEGHLEAALQALGVSVHHGRGLHTRVTPAPLGRVEVDLDRARIARLPLPHGVYAEPAWFRLPDALVDSLRARGLRRVTACLPRSAPPIALLRPLLALTEDDSPMAEHLHLSLHHAPGPSVPWRSEARRPLRIPLRAPDTLRYGRPVVTLGSCFADRVGSRLAVAGFEVDVNPLGTLYDPVSIARGLQWLLADEPLPEEALTEGRERHRSWWHHHDFSRTSRGELLEHIEARATWARRQLSGPAPLVILTLGTAVVHELRATGEVVANCHHDPAERFRRRRLSPSEVTDALSPALQALFEAQPEADVWLTVSPVRHLRFGSTENLRSKAALALAAEALSEAFPRLHVLPVLELFMDELRAERWWDADGVHPSEAAVEQVEARIVEGCAPEATAREHLRRRRALEEVASLPSDPVSRREALAALLARACAPASDPAAPPMVGLITWLQQELAP